MSSSIYKKYVKTPDGLSTFMIVFDGAGIYENKETYGYSHLIEHLVASKLKAYENKFNEVGIKFNAYTTNDQVSYFIGGLDAGVCKYKKLLIKTVKSGLNGLTEKRLEDEKKIVLREYEMHTFQPIMAHIEYLGRKEFNLVSPVGTIETINGATVEKVKEFFKRQFNMPDAIIDVSSKDDSEKLMKSIYEKDIEFLDTYRPILRFRLGRKNSVPTNDICKTYFDETTSIISAFPVKYNEIPYMELAASVLCNGLSSPLYNEIRTKHNLAYAVFSQVYPAGKDFGVFIIGFEAETKNVNKAKGILHQILNNPKKYLKIGRFKSICSAIKAQHQIDTIRVNENPGLFLDYENSKEELVMDNECNEILLSKTIKAFEKVVKNIDKHIYTYQGNPAFKPQK